MPSKQVRPKGNPALVNRTGRSRTFPLVLLTVLLICCPAFADWPMFRGNPARTGVAETQDSPGLDLVWKQKLGNLVDSSPAVVDGVVYVGSSDGFVHALRASDGQALWKYETDGAVTSSPAVAGGLVYVGSVDRCIYALRAEDGSPAWVHRTGGPVVSSPAVADGLVTCGSMDGNLYALDATSGAERWTARSPMWISSSPAVADGHVFVALSDERNIPAQGRIRAFRAADGKMIWEYAMALAADRGGRVWTSPAVDQGVLYIGGQDNIMHAIDATNGARRWMFKCGDKQPMWMISSSAAVLEGVAYFGCFDTLLYAVGAGEPRWKCPLNNIVDSSPAIAGRTLYVGSADHHVYAVNIDSGEPVARFETGGIVVSSPAVSDERVFIGSSDGNLYCFQ